MGWRATNVLFGLLFAVAAGLQLNDPDPAPWCAIYAAAAGVCVSGLVARASWIAALVIGAVALVWAGTLVPQVIATGEPFGRIADSMSATTPGIELLRETLGLTIVAAWMAIVAFHLKRSVAAAKDPATTRRRPP
jgi:hypothetical protein